MKRKSTFFCVICAMVLGLYGAIPAFAVVNPTGWATLPLTDSVDDVYQYTSDFLGGIGNHKDEIDIKSVFIQGLNLTIEFCAPPIQDGDKYNFTVYFNTDGDADAEYFLYTHSGPSGYLDLIRCSDGFHWSGSAFTGPNSIPYPGSFEGNYLIIINISKPIPSYLSMQIAVVVTCMEDAPTYYMDISPNPVGIPSFSWILALISILTLLGIIFYKRQGKINF